MPYMCNLQIPKGKSPEVIEKTMIDISRVLIENFQTKPGQVRVIVDELPRKRYIAGGVMTSDMAEFNEFDKM